MEVAALCITLLLLILTLLAARVQNSAAALRIVPDRLQFFEYESVSFHCEGLDGSTQLRGIRNSEGFISMCDKRMETVSCTIQRAYLTDSGEYWCETEGGQRSNSVNITVTAGSVILESPVLPLTEGDTVTLCCKNKMTSFSLAANFYKDEVFMGNSSVGNLTIHSVSKSDEGLYKCNISDVGESPQSWLTVRARHSETCPHHSCHIYLVFRTVFIIVMVALLLLLVGLLHYGKLRVTYK